MSNLPEKMKAIVAYAPGDYRLETVDTPQKLWIHLTPVKGR